MKAAVACNEEYLLFGTSALSAYRRAETEAHCAHSS